MSVNIKQILAIIAVVFTIAAVLVIGNRLYNRFVNQDPVPVTMTTEDAEDPTKLKQAVNNAQATKLGDDQAKTVSASIKSIVDGNRAPVTTTSTTAANYKATATTYAKSVGADATVITPSKNEARDVTKVDPSTPVQLNQYNIKAYPKTMIGVGAYSDKSVVVDYQKQVKVFGQPVYIGPSVKVDGTGSAAIGVKLTAAF